MPPRSPRVLLVMLGIALAAFLATGFILVRKFAAGPAAASDSRPPPAHRAARAGLDELTIPEFSLVDQQGRPFTRERLLGKLTILSVNFTNCPLACPAMTEKMHAMAEALDDAGGRAGGVLQFVSISVDPQRDTPERLREFRRLHEIDRAEGSRAGGVGVGYKWFHLTSPDGSRDYIAPIVEQGLKCALEEERDRPLKASDGSEMYNILHPTWFFLIDGRGKDGTVRVLDLYQSTSDDEMQRLEREVRALLK